VSLSLSCKSSGFYGLEGCLLTPENDSAVEGKSD